MIRPLILSAALLLGACDPLITMAVDAALHPIAAGLR